MSIRTRLLLCLLSLSALTLIVGVIFYSQLKGLIQPLTPQSIPRSVEKLENTIMRNSLTYQLLYQQQTVQMNLEDYVLSHNISNLQDFYMNQALFIKLLDNALIEYPNIYKDLQPVAKQLNDIEKNIIESMKSNQSDSARQLLLNTQFISLRHHIISIINKHYVNFDILTNESDVITVKLAAKHTSHVLLNSMNTTIIIFLDAVVISLLLALLGTDVVWRPIKLLRNNMERITRKSLDIPIKTTLLHFKGEIGDLAQSYANLISKLRATMVSRDKLQEEIQRRIISEENLRQTAKNLQESNLELDQFAYSASHDLRAPLRGIQSLCQWIREDCYSILPKESQKHFDLLEKRAKRLDALIHGILEYSRAGKPNSKTEIVDLNNLLLEIIDTLSPPKNTHIKIDMTLPVILTYKVMITQVFLNLLSNAIKFQDKPETYINIGYEDSDKYYRFYIKDNGTGIDPQFHKKIFVLFQTLQSRDTIEGAGIGLPMVKKIIEMQGGTIEVDSVPKVGSTFYFTWPKK